MKAIRDHRTALWFYGITKNMLHGERWRTFQGEAFLIRHDTCRPRKTALRCFCAHDLGASVPVSCCKHGLAARANPYCTYALGL